MQHKKTLHFDTETTGTNPDAHAIIQFAGLIEVDDKPIDELVVWIRPFANAIINEKALEVNGIKEADFATDKFVKESEAHRLITRWLDKHVDKYNKVDKLTPVAFNGSFDVSFMSAMWFRLGDKYLGSYIDRNKLVDPLRIVTWLQHRGLMPILANNKLGTICEHFGITIENAHEALSDVKAMRELLHALDTRIIMTDAATLDNLNPLSWGHDKLEQMRKELGSETFEREYMNKVTPLDGDNG